MFSICSVRYKITPSTQKMAMFVFRF